ncbi:MAG: carboxylate-amine ligase [Solirubrobacteraceae bacterium]
MASACTLFDAREIKRRQILERQLVASLHVHVAVPGVDRSLAVFNALRCYLPELAALAANAPFYAGRDTGLATVRPKINEQLPRHGVPPRIESWERFVSELEWGAAAGAVPQPSYWWWDLRPHIEFATLELRIPDAQSTLDEVAGVLALTQALVATLAGRFDAGEPLPDAPAWRIEENRWLAVRYGLEGELADLDTGERTSTRERLRELVDEVRPAAAARRFLDG